MSPDGIALLSFLFEANVRISKMVSVEVDKTLVEGLIANFTAKTVFALNGTDWTVAEIAKAFNERISASAKAAAAQIAWRAAVKAERGKDEAIQPLRQALKQSLGARYGSDAAKLREFGFEPSKTRKVSVKTKAKALDQAAATRKARSTMGKKQRKGIKGVVSDLPTSSDSEPTPNPAPAVATTPAVNAAGAPSGQSSS